MRGKTTKDVSVWRAGKEDMGPRRGGVMEQHLICEPLELGMIGIV